MQKILTLCNVSEVLQNFLQLKMILYIIYKFIDFRSFWSFRTGPQNKIDPQIKFKVSWRFWLHTMTGTQSYSNNIPVLLDVSKYHGILLFLYYIGILIFAEKIMFSNWRSGIFVALPNQISSDFHHIPRHS